MPSYFIYFNLDPSTIDVNIHPTKTEIKFENEQPIWQILLATVRETLAKSSAIPTIDFNTEGAIDIPIYNPGKRVSGNSSPKVEVRSNYNPFQREIVHPDKAPAFDWTELYNNFEADRSSALPEEEDNVVEKRIPTIDSEERPILPTEQEPEKEKALFSANPTEQSHITPCFQYKNRYLITSLKSGMAIIDQHRAHVRILFEQYQKSILQQKSVSQQMLFPAMVDFTQAEEQVLADLLQDLNYSGFELSNLGGGSYAINGVPSGMEGVDCVNLLKEIVVKSMETGIKDP